MTKDIADEVRRRFAEYDEVPASLQVFLERASRRARWTEFAIVRQRNSPIRTPIPVVWSHSAGTAMPINRLFRDGKIKSEEVERLNRAYSFTLRSLSLVDRDNDPVCEIIARKVIEIDAAGTREPKEIASLAVKQLGLP
jgi:hypothetical protein